MPSEDSSDASTSPQRPRDALIARSSPWNIFEIPKPIKRIFNRFPLLSYPANQLPLRAPRARTQHTLYVFDANGSRNEASCNPSCLKWQAYLKILQIPFVSIASNNHASPSGSLPFLLPISSSQSQANQPPAPISTSKLLKWSRGEAKEADEILDTRAEAYQALLDVSVRKAWLYHLYLSPSNLTSVAIPCYIHPASSNQLVGATLAYDLRSAATAEILKSTHLTAPSSSLVIDAESLYSEAEDAFQALSALLAGDEWFFGAKQPGLMDACVFAYTHLLLDETFGWTDKRLNDNLRKLNNMVRHRARLLEKYF